MALEVDIKKTVGKFTLDVKFEAQQEIFALLGASGCGKSMTLRCIAGIDTPDEARIVLNGRTLYDSNQKINLTPQKRNVGYMFQDYALFPNMTVVKNIMAGMGKNPSVDIVNRYIEMFQLNGLEEHLPRQLSGGQKQRVALARMLAAEPEILLLDEPLSALDAYLKWQMEEELLEVLKRVDKTVMFVSHSRDEVYHLCDTVCVLEKGHMETIQGKREFFANPQTVAAARISGVRNISSAKRLSDHELLAEEWGIRFYCEKPIREDLAFVGIRAHYIEIPGEDENREKNVAEMTVDHLFEQQFESELVLNPGVENGKKMRLLMEKEKAEQLAKKKQIRIYFPEEALLLLRA